MSELSRPISCQKSKLFFTFIRNLTPAEESGNHASSLQELVLDEHESLACTAFAFHDAQGGLAQGQGEGVSRHAIFSRV